MVNLVQRFGLGFLVAPAVEQQSDLSSLYGVCLRACLLAWLFVDREVYFEYCHQMALFVLVLNINTRWHIRLILNIDNRGLSILVQV